MSSFFLGRKIDDGRPLAVGAGESAKTPASARPLILAGIDMAIARGVLGAAAVAAE